MSTDIDITGFGLAEIKVEGQMTIPDGHPLPKLPPKYICTSVRLAGEVLTRKEYTIVLIKNEPFFRGSR